MMKRHCGDYPAPFIPIPGWMSGAELEWLYHRAKEHQIIVEVGSAFGRSSHALLTGNYDAFGDVGRVYCVDLWPTHIKGTKNDFNYDHKDLDRRHIFGRNALTFPNLNIWEMPSVWASDLVKKVGLSPGMVFLDGGVLQMHTDILHWMSSSESMLFCGHDYSDEYPEAKQAVDELVNGFQVVEGTSIWYLEVGK